jgi:hypothetical protein
MKIINEIIDKSDLELLNNQRVVNMSVNQWGKAVSTTNEYIQKNILQFILGDDYKLSMNLSNNNGIGYDILLNGNIKIQSKLRQVKGVTPYSSSLHFETTRRNSNKNLDKNITGHVCYSLNEFDYVCISLIHNRIDRSDVNNWKFILIPNFELLDDNGFLKTKIQSKLLKKYEINDKDDILRILNVR